MDRTPHGEFDRIADQVEHDLAQAKRIGDAPAFVRTGVYFELESLALGSSHLQRHALIDQPDDVDWRLLDHDLACLDLRQVENVVEQQHHRAARLHDQLGVPPLFSLQRLLQQQLGKTEHAIHGRAYLVAHVGEELRFCMRGIFRVPAGPHKLQLQLDAGRNVAGRYHDTFRLAGRGCARDGAIGLDIDRLSIRIVEQAAIGEALFFRFT